MIIIIVPSDPTIKSVVRLAKRLSKDYGCKLKIIHPGSESKAAIHSYIRELSDNDAIVFLGHGRSDGLFGGRGRYWNVYVSEEARQENVNYYNDENFVDNSCYDLFSGKGLVCFACRSKELAEHLFESGANVILGYGQIPSTKEEVIEQCKIKNPNSHLVSAINGSINSSFGRAIGLAIQNKSDYRDLFHYLRSEIQIQIVRSLSSKAHYRYELANILAMIRDEICIVGDGTLALE